MSTVFDPVPEFASAMAALDKADQACALTVDDVALRADIAELIEAETLMIRHGFRRSQLLIDLASEEREKAKPFA